MPPPEGCGNGVRRTGTGAGRRAARLGTVLVWQGDRWSNAPARGHVQGAHVDDPFKLRLNAYRVLLTRGRDATVVFVLKLRDLDATYEYLCRRGFVIL